VKVDEYDQFIEPLRNRELDFYVADISEIRAAPDVNITRVPPQEIVWFCRPGHPLAGRGALQLAALFQYPVVLPALPRWATDWIGTNTNGQKKETSAASPFRPAVTCSHFSALKAMVLNSDSVCGTTRPAIKADFRANRFAHLPVSGAPAYSDAGIVSLKGRTLSPIAVKLIDEIEQQIRNW
jgi:DNA-binding transcriptional LysR family regulator